MIVRRLCALSLAILGAWVVAGGCSGSGGDYGYCEDSGAYTDPETGMCVECLEDSDCEEMRCAPGGFCGCLGDADCASNADGSMCMSDFSCGCAEDADCTQPRRHGCVPQAMRCGCGSDADCPGAHCQLSSGRCVACVVDADCADPSNPACQVEPGVCVACKQDSDCAHNPSGKHCKDLPTGPQCYCLASAECTESPLGPYCWVDAQQCGCATDDDCAASPAGSHCVVSGNGKVCS